MAGIEYFPEYDCTERLIEGAVCVGLVTGLARYRIESGAAAAMVMSGMVVTGVVEGMWVATVVWGALAMLVDEVSRRTGKDMVHAVMKIPLFIAWVTGGFTPQVAMALTALYAVEGEVVTCASIWACLLRSVMSSSHCATSLLPVTLLLADGIPSLVSHIYRSQPRMPLSLKQRLSRACSVFTIFLMMLVAVTHAVTSTSSLSFMAGAFVLVAHVHSLLLHKKYSTANLAAPQPEEVSLYKKVQ